ncbi:DNA-binding response regulator [Enterococcus sp. JM4C]|uniref:response regulator transcription factor n=1 Tax=Candidatus Enterococcus huntleyi TaxID=1857217 RepID=UPI00137A5BC5|nr:response regulator transcription factor [Enterococcus sp. JM4C]KAF1297602.1 DNA-binding response regulator [Enterococcus sp. JM4C]
MKIFLVEDDEKIVRLVTSQLEKYGYQVVTPEDFQTINETFNKEQPQLVLLDVNLPYFDGFYWCRKIRETSLVPILFISSRDSNMDQVMALEYGADDYLVKPFSYEILIAKIKSLLRRVGEYLPAQEERAFSWEGLSYYPERLEMSFQGKTELLTKREGELLDLFLTATPKIVRREQILNKLWDDENFVDDNTLSVNITRLRKKLATLGMENVLHTVRGQGYQLRKEDA